MADVRHSSGPGAWLAGLAAFTIFELAAYYGLRWLLVTLLGPPGPDSTVVANWERLTGFLVLHIGLLVAAVLTLNNWLPRRHRGPVMGWFYAGLLLGLVLAATLY